MIGSSPLGFNGVINLRIYDENKILSINLKKYFFIEKSTIEEYVKRLTLESPKVPFDLTIQKIFKFCKISDFDNKNYFNLFEIEIFIGNLFNENFKEKFSDDELYHLLNPMVQLESSRIIMLGVFIELNSKNYQNLEYFKIDHYSHINYLQNSFNFNLIFYLLMITKDISFDITNVIKNKKDVFELNQLESLIEFLNLYPHNHFIYKISEDSFIFNLVKGKFKEAMKKLNLIFKTKVSARQLMIMPSNDESSTEEDREIFYKSLIYGMIIGSKDNFSEFFEFETDVEYSGGYVDILGINRIKNFGVVLEIKCIPCENRNSLANSFETERRRSKSADKIKNDFKKECDKYLKIAESQNKYFRSVFGRRNEYLKEKYLKTMVFDGKKMDYRIRKLN